MDVNVNTDIVEDCLGLRGCNTGSAISGTWNIVLMHYFD